MEFASAKHQEVFERVKVYLHELFEDKLYFEQETGHFYLRYGSAALAIRAGRADPEGAEDQTINNTT